MKPIRGTVLLATLCVAGCQTWGPTWSELSGDRYTRVDPDRRAAILERVGNDSVGSITPYKLAPGSYRVLVSSPPYRGFRGSEKAMMLDVAPCKRYYINAQFDNRVGPDWMPVVDHVESIAGCRIAAQ